MADNLFPFMTPLLINIFKKKVVGMGMQTSTYFHQFTKVDRTLLNTQMCFFLTMNDFKFF